MIVEQTKTSLMPSMIDRLTMINSLRPTKRRRLQLLIDAEYCRHDAQVLPSILICTLPGYPQNVTLRTLIEL
jgi:hypothetical protein